VRATAITLALLLAVGATAAVFLYVNSVKKQHKAPVANDVAVIVSKQDIPADTKLDSLISAGEFTTLQIPRAAVVPGAVTDLSQLRGRTTSTFILQGEQITTARFQGTTHATGGILGLGRGLLGVSIQLAAQKVPGQVLQPGDHVTVYATFTGTSIISDASVRAVLQGKSTSTTSANVGDFTVDLVPDAQVVRVNGETQSTLSGSSNGDNVMVTLALLPKDAQNVIFAQERGDLWLALQPPGQKGTPQPPVNIVPILQQAVLHGGAK